MIGAVDGVRIGHWTDADARTGCTVVLLPEGTVASAEVRGGAPATRELDLLEPGRLVERLDAVVLTGGSAFGLAAADGVVRWCEEHSIGFPTAAGPVPIVAALGLFDLAVGDPSVRPDASAGYAACEEAAPGPEASGHGTVGAGTGCTVAKWQGRDHARPGGLGGAVLDDGDLRVAALLAVNAFGVVAATDPGGRVPRLPRLQQGDAALGANTTIGVVVTNARLTKVACRTTCAAAHDGFARALDPAHTAVDGDAVIVAATGTVDADPAVVAALAAAAVEQAIRSAIGPVSPPAPAA